MRVEVVIADWCGKCHQAKNRLKDYDIRWIDVNSEEGQEIVGDFGIERIPTLILYYDDGTLEITTCIMCVKDVLDGKTEKIEHEREKRRKEVSGTIPEYKSKNPIR